MSDDVRGKRAKRCLSAATGLLASALLLSAFLLSVLSTPAHAQNVAQITLDADIAGDDVINIAERAAGFVIRGTATEASMVRVTIGAETLTTEVAVGATGWQINVPADASYITGTELTIEAMAARIGYEDSIVQSRVLRVDLEAPNLRYAPPGTLAVGVAITELAPLTAATDIPATAAYALVSGDLPAGLMLNEDRGVISGTPTTAGTAPSELTVGLTDTAGNSTATAVMFPPVDKGERMIVGLAYSAERVSKQGPAPTLTTPTLSVSLGDADTLSYASDSEAVCTVDSMTGEVTLVGVAGTCTITATAAETANYNEARAEVSLVVTEFSPTAFITTWNIRAGESLVIRNTPRSAGDYTVAWGDDTTTPYSCTANTACNATHTYPTAGNYRVIIEGDGFQNALFNNIARLATVEQWGAIRWTTMRDAFNGASNLTYNATDAPDLSRVTDLQRMFFNAGKFNGNLNSWDVSNVTDMESLFRNATAFNGDISDWDVSAVSDMQGMFNNAVNFNGDLSRWDVSRVANMGTMFFRASQFAGDLSRWDVSRVTNMQLMFFNAERFNSNIGAWNVSRVSNMSFMFNGARGFRQSLAPWYIRLNNTTIASGAAPGVARRIGVISAQNAALRGQGARYEVDANAGDDSDLFEIADGNTLKLKDTAPTPDFERQDSYTVTITVQGNGIFGTRPASLPIEIEVTPVAEISLGENIAGDDIVNITERATGFAITGTVEAGAAVELTVGGTGLAATVTGEQWRADVPADAAYLVEPQVEVRAVATHPDFDSGVATRTLRVDLMPPSARYTPPDALTVGVIIDDLAPLGLPMDIPSTGAYAVASGDLPSGLMLDEDSGAIRGTPEAVDANPAGVAIRLRDEAGNPAEVALTFPPVGRGEQTLSGFAYSPTQVSVLGAPPTLTPPTVTVPVGDERGDLSYRSDTPAVCAVDAMTGELRLAGMIGTCTITVTAAATTNYMAASIAVNVTVIPAPRAEVTLAADIAGDDVVNIAERAAGFAIRGTATETSTVTVTIGAETLTTEVAVGVADWQVDVAADAPYITGTELTIEAMAARIGYEDSIVQSRVLRVDLEAPNLSYVQPSTPTVGVAITALAPLTAATDIPATAAYALVSGDLPAGLMLNEDRGVISGTPTTAGGVPSELTVGLTDIAGNSTAVAVVFPPVAKGTQVLTGLAYTPAEVSASGIPPRVTPPTVRVPLGEAGGVTYRSADETVCTVQAMTGELTLVGAAGTCTITAIAAETENYNAASVEAVVTVTEAMAVEITVEADITEDNVVNLAERAAGFAISGMATPGAAVEVAVGLSSTLTATVAGDVWRVNVPPFADYLTGMQVEVQATATRTGLRPGTARRTLHLNLTTPTATYAPPPTLTVGVTIEDITATDVSPDVPSAGAYVLASGALPTGLRLNPDSGAFTGTPTRADSSPAPVAIRLSDTAANTTELTLVFPPVAKGTQVLTGFAYSATRLTTLDVMVPTVTPPTVTVPVGEVVGVVTYASDNAEVCAADSMTGDLSFSGKPGACTITATAAETANYFAASAQVELVVAAVSTAAFVTTWAVEAGDTVTLVNTPLSVGSYTVRWGDGTSDRYECGGEPLCNALHTYTAAGTYVVIVEGDGFQNMISPNSSQLASLEQWGTIRWTTLSNAFAGASQLVYNADDTPDLSRVTDLSGLFNGASTFNGDLSGWDVSAVEIMAGMFTDATAFESDLSGWDVANVTDMSGMFFNAANFNSDLSGWDVSAVENMLGMFTGATQFDANLGTWYIRLDNLTIASNATSPSIGTISALNEDLRNRNITYGIDNTAGDDSAQFEVVGSNLRLTEAAFASDFAQQLAYTVTLTAQGDVFGARPASRVIEIEVMRIAEITLAEDIAGDDVINIAEYAAGFAIRGTATEESTVRVTVGGSEPLTTEVAPGASDWQVDVPMNAPYISGQPVEVHATAVRRGYEDSVTITRSLRVDLTAPTVRYALPSTLTLTVGVPIDTIVARGAPEDVPASGAYALTSGVLPVGLALDADGGALSGTPQAANPNPAEVTIVVRDEAGNPFEVELDFPAVAKGTQTLTGFAYSSTQVNLLAPPPTVAPAMVAVPVGQAGTVTYVSDNRAACEVNETTGELTLVGVGLCTITAMAAETDHYLAARVAVRLEVTAFSRAAFVTTWDAVGGEAMTLLSTPTVAARYTVNWGDGTSSTRDCMAQVACDAEHTYSDTGTYRVVIEGAGFENVRLSHPERLATLEQWGDIRWTTLESAFSGAFNMIYNASDAPDLSRVTDMSQLFSGAVQFDGDLNHWDVSQVVNMSGVFQDAEAFNGDLSDWEVSQVTDMSDMFLFALQFNGDLSGWDVSRVTEMGGMFADAAEFNGDLSGWEVSQVTDMNSMFSFASQFNQDLSGWDVSAVTSMNQMFSGADSFDANLGAWYIQLDSLTLSEGAATQVGTLTAQNTPLRDQNPRYALDVSAGDDSALFEIADGNLLRLRDSAPPPNLINQPTYRVTITADGSIFGTRPATRQVMVEVTPATQVVAQGTLAITADSLQIGDRFLRAELANLTDANGLRTAVYAYQWLRQDDAAGTNQTEIAGATQPRYRLTPADEGKYVAVRVRFTDDARHEEVLESAAVGPVFGPPLPPLRVEAGDPLAAYEGAAVTLTGRAVHFADAALSYTWTHDAPSALGLTFATGLNRSSLTFTAPPVAQDTDITFTLEVSDGTLRAMDRVTVTVEDSAAAFITTWDAVGGEAMTLLSTPAVTARYTVEWGDGTRIVRDCMAQVACDAEHTYSDTGTYRVVIEGAGFENVRLSHPERLATLEQWGGIRWTTMASTFQGAANLVYNASDAPDLSRVTDMSQLFSGAVQFNGDLNHWDVSNVVNMAGVFQDAEAFNGDLSDWDVSQVTDMSDMFLFALQFNGDLSDWDVSQVTEMGGMFADATEFNSDLSGWDVSQVTDMNSMFSFALQFNQDLSGWDVSAVTSMNQMFSGADSFDANLGAWYIQLDNQSVVEASTRVGTITAQNSPLRNQTPTYGLVTTANDDTHRFEIVDGNTLGLKAVAPSMEAQPSYRVTIRADGSIFGTQPATRQVRVEVTTATQVVAQGAPAIIGRAQVGQTLDSATTDIMDANGLTSVRYAYQWLRQDDPSTSTRQVEIDGATGVTYTPTETDEGKYLALRVTFDDDLGNLEVTTSTVVGPVLPVPQVEVGGHRIAYEGAAVVLTAAVMHFGETSPRYTWTHDAPSALGLTFATGLNQSSLTFTAPPVAQDTDITFTLEVSDGTLRAMDRVTVTVEDSAEAFITTWDAVGGEAMTLLSTPTVTARYTVEWGDGTRITRDCVMDEACDAEHTYSDTGTYRVVIEGAGFENVRLSHPERLATLEQWGGIRWTTMASTFLGAANLVYNASDAPDLSRVTDMSELFRGATRFNGDLNHWDVSNVMNMERAFQDASAFTSDLNSWDVSDVTSMEFMFLNASEFDGDISRWDVSQVTSMRGMFFNTPFNQDLSNWKVSGVTNMNGMFASATQFNQDLSEWDVSGVTDMGDMFVFASQFNSDLSGWDVSNVTNMRRMFSGADLFTANLGAWYIQLDSLTLSEGASTRVGTIAAQNTPLRDQNPRYALDVSAGDDSALFEIADGNLLRLRDSAPPPNLINQSTYRVTITADGSIFGTRPATRQVRVEVTTATQVVAEGTPVITGTPQVGRALSVTLDDITDANGLRTAVYAYQWLRQDDAAGTNQTEIAGATEADYTLTTADQGKYLVVRVSFTDDARHEEQLNSPAVGPSLAAPAVEVGDDRIVYEGAAVVLTADAMRFVETSPRYTWTHDAPSALGLTFATGLNRSSLTFTAPPVAQDTDITFTLEVSDGTLRAMDRVTVTIEDSAAAFITTWDAVGGEAMTLLSTPAVTARYTVEWGDGTRIVRDCMAQVACDAEHTYSDTGTYRVVIEGAGFENVRLSHPERLATLEQWGDIRWTTMASTFQGAANLVYNASDAPDLSRVTDMSELFRGATRFNGDLNHWDVSQVVNMAGVFQDAEAFNGDLSDWEVSSVTDMSELFRGATRFNGDLSHWDVSQVVNMAGAFQDAEGFDGDLSDWDVSAVTDMSELFSGAMRFNGDLSGWDIVNVTDMTDMFAEPTAFNQNLGRWYIQADSRTVVQASTRVATLAARNMPLRDQNPTYGVDESAGDDSALFEITTDNTLSLREPVQVLDARSFYRVTVTAGGDIFGMTPATRQLIVQATTTTQVVAQGAPMIIGRAQVSRALRSTTTDIVDSNGLTEVEYAYQWLRQDDPSTSTRQIEIDEATGLTYTPTEEDAGQYIALRVTFNDDLGGEEVSTSRAVGPVIPPIAVGFDTATIELVRGTTTPVSVSIAHLFAEDGGITIGFEVSEELGLAVAPVTLSAETTQTEVIIDASDKSRARAGVGVVTLRLPASFPLRIDIPPGREQLAVTVTPDAVRFRIRVFLEGALQ